MTTVTYVARPITKENWQEIMDKYGELINPASEKYVVGQYHIIDTKTDHGLDTYILIPNGYFDYRGVAKLPDGIIAKKKAA